jgi:hypothetical protein
MQPFGFPNFSAKIFQSTGLTRSLLRSTTLSTASGKEGIFFTLFPQSGERVEQRSVFGVSKRAG